VRAISRCRPRGFAKIPEADLAFHVVARFCPSLR
jgi:hypothetical protein